MAAILWYGTSTNFYPPDRSTIQYGATPSRSFGDDNHRDSSKYQWDLMRSTRSVCSRLDINGEWCIYRIIGQITKSYKSSRLFGDRYRGPSRRLIEFFEQSLHFAFQAMLEARPVKLVASFDSGYWAYQRQPSMKRTR